ncbi:uncharacterized protein BDR25DRAFT_358486 [Lindgomyces ingoldianus]|uniref:Uncharacterized protein n=1 Tax=Lindgomyces ingoldianus TaxID=673940 RepID=A0ACB6QLI0_9PLEO|nr:uncharacterized protein BDR25DRAFT_358486 [Lindgomyces ingoldianus]KAF2467380.1 hypothetical protein BDR25DRAFT_358486 [Lindgomyces ingoldianus]
MECVDWHYITTPSSIDTRLNKAREGGTMLFRGNWRDIDENHELLQAHKPIKYTTIFLIISFTETSLERQILEKLSIMFAVEKNTNLDIGVRNGGTFTRSGVLHTTILQSRLYITPLMSSLSLFHTSRYPPSLYFGFSKRSPLPGTENRRHFMKSAEV